MPFIESAQFNKGKQKLYKGVAGNLVAFGCKISFEKGYDGVVSFIAKSRMNYLSMKLILFPDSQR